MPKILISPGWGAGWSTCSSGNPEEEKFPLTYKPIIEFLEAGNYFESGKDYPSWHKDNTPLHPVLQQFVDDLAEKFGEGAHFYLGGAEQLVVTEVPNSFRVDEYDGYESVVTENDFITIEDDDE